jgi:hypothetical protein
VIRSRPATGRVGSLLFGLVALNAVQGEETKGLGSLGFVVAVLGALMTAGSVWSSLFVVPGLAEVAPSVLETGVPSVFWRSALRNRHSSRWGRLEGAWGAAHRPRSRVSGTSTSPVLPARHSRQHRRLETQLRNYLHWPNGADACPLNRSLTYSKGEPVAE